MSNIRRHKNPPITTNLDNISSSGSSLFEKQISVEKAMEILKEPVVVNDVPEAVNEDMDFDTFRKMLLNRNLDENDGSIQDNKNQKEEGDLISAAPSATIIPPLSLTTIDNGGIQTISLNVKYLDHYTDLPPLEYKSNGAVGFDLYAANFEPICLNKQGGIVMVPTGISIELPPGFEAQVRSRSSMAAKFGITVVNSPGTIDWDYRGEIFVALINLVGKRFIIERGMRIAQVVIPAPIVRATFVDVASLTETKRGSGGFGSTGR